MPDRKEYIERGALLQDIEENVLFTVRGDVETPTPEMRGARKVKERIEEAPTADVVEVVRCRDCKKRYVPAYCALWYGQINDEHGCRDIFLRAHNDDFYCAYGERKDGADND